MTNKITQQSIILSISLSQFAIPFMFSGVGITLPTLGKDLGASAVELGLIESVYLGAAAAFLLPAGKLADLTDKKYLFKAGLVIFALMTLLLGLTHNIELFIGMRFLQGIAGAVLLATNMAILTELIPKEHLGKAIGIAVGSVYMGLTTGPLVAGVITTHWGWEYVYFMGGSLISLVALISLFKIPHDKKFKFVKIDLIGSLLIIFSISSLIAGSSLLKTGLLGPLLLCLGVILMMMFIYEQKRSKHPLINLNLFVINNRLTTALMAQFINYAGTFGITFLFSIYLQTIKKMTPQEAGMVMIISPIIMAFLAPVFGKLSDKVSPAKLSLSGMSACLIATIIALTVSATTPMWVIYVQFVFMGVGFAMFSSPNMKIILSSVERNLLSMASAITALLRSLGMVISLICISIFLSLFMGHREIIAENSAYYLKAMHFSILSFVILMVIGVVISLFMLNKPTSK